MQADSERRQRKRKSALCRGCRSARSPLRPTAFIGALAVDSLGRAAISCCELKTSLWAVVIGCGRKVSNAPITAAPAESISSPWLLRPQAKANRFRRLRPAATQGGPARGGCAACQAEPPAHRQPAAAAGLCRRLPSPVKLRFEVVGRRAPGAVEPAPRQGQQPWPQPSRRPPSAHRPALRRRPISQLRSATATPRQGGTGQGGAAQAPFLAAAMLWGAQVQGGIDQPGRDPLPVDLVAAEAEQIDARFRRLQGIWAEGLGAVTVKGDVPPATERKRSQARGLKHPDSFVWRAINTRPAQCRPPGPASSCSRSKPRPIGPTGSTVSEKPVAAR